MRHSLLSLLLLALISSVTWAGSEYFNAPREFPDLFLSHEQREKTSLSHAEVLEREQLLNDALASLYQRMTIPLIQDDGKVHVTRAFPYLQKLAAEKAQGEFKIYAAGGVVRSALAFLYAEMYKQWLQDPDFDSAEFLRNFTAETTDLPGIQVRGIGSDFDILIKDPSQKNTRLKEEILEIINSAETKFGLTSFQDELKKTMITVGDVKSYDEQMTRATAQGGSTLDFLTFDISEGKLREPQKFPGTISDFLRGFISYVAPLSAQVTEDLSKQTVRGLRPLLEIPFVRYKNEETLRAELKTLERTGLSARATEQIEKLARNARFSAANNRFYRGAPDSLEQLIHQVLRNKSLLSQIPRYIDLNPLQQRGEDRGLNGFPEKLLMSRERFNQLTSGGTLYHGTPHVKAGLSIMRSGLFESSEAQGIAAFGRGAYSTPDPGTALGYAGGGNGIIFRVQVKNDPRVNVIDWEEIKESSFIKNLQRECAFKHLDLFQELSRRHGIDIIYNNHFLIENQDAILLPSSFADLLESYRLRILAGTTPWLDKMEALRYYINYAKYAADLGIHIISPSQLVSQLISTEHYNVQQILTLFKYSNVSLDDLSYAHVEWIKKALLKDFANLPRPQQNEILPLLLKRSSAEQAADRFALTDSEISDLQRMTAANFPRELRLHLISLKAKPDATEIADVLQAARDGAPSEKLMAIPAVYRITGQDLPWLELVHSLQTSRKNSALKKKDLISFFSFSNDLKNPSPAMKKAVLTVAPQLGTQQILFTDLLGNPDWFADLPEILNAFAGARNNDLIYNKVLLDNRWSGSPALDQFLFKEIQNGNAVKVLSALMSGPVSSRLSNSGAVRSALVQQATQNYSSSLTNILLQMNPPLSQEQMDALVLSGLRAGKEIPSSLLRHQVSLELLPKTYQFLQTNPDYLRLKVPEGTMRSLIRADAKMMDLAVSVAKYDAMTALFMQSAPALLDRPAVQQWLKKQIQANPNKAFLLRFLTDARTIQRPDWISLATLYARQKPEYRESILLSPAVRENRAQLGALEQALGASPALNKKNILKINELRPQDLDQAAQIPPAELSGAEMASILSRATALKKSPRFHQVMDAYLSDPRFKIYLFAGFADVFDSLPPELRKKALLALSKESLTTKISILETNPAALTTLSELPEADILALAKKYLQGRKLESLVGNKNPKAEPLKTLLPKFLNAAREAKNLNALSYFLTSQVSLTDRNDLKLLAALDTNAAVSYIFKYQRFDADSLQTLRELATAKKEAARPLVRWLALTPHFPNRTAWLENLVQSKPGFDALMTATRKSDSAEFSAADPAFLPVMLAALKVNYQSTDMAQRVAHLSTQKPALARVLFSAWLQNGDKIQSLAQAFANNDFLKKNPDLLQSLTHSQSANPSVRKIYINNPIWNSLLQGPSPQKLKCSAMFL